MSVSGKVALVTGGAQGLGLAFCKELLAQGAKVVLTDINEEQGQASVSKLASEFGQNNVSFRKCDTTNGLEMRETFEGAKSQFGSLDIVINNAGIGREFDGWEKTVDVNVKGTIQGTTLAIELMRRDKGGNGGVIVNVSSMAGINPNPCGPVYGATKAAILMYSLAFAANPEISMNGVRINVLCPAFVETPLFNSLGTTSQIYLPQVATKIQEKVGVMTPEYVASNMMELIEDQTKNGAVMKLAKATGKQYHTA